MLSRLPQWSIGSCTVWLWRLTLALLYHTVAAINPVSAYQDCEEISGLSPDSFQAQNVLGNA